MIRGGEANDSLSEWDDDLMVGLVHIVDTRELLKVVENIGSTGQIGL